MPEIFIRATVNALLTSFAVENFPDELELIETYPHVSIDFSDRSSNRLRIKCLFKYDVGLTRLQAFQALPDNVMVDFNTPPAGTIRDFFGEKAHECVSFPKNRAVEN